MFERAAGKPRVNPFVELARHWKIALYLVVLMTAFNFFSHGTQDLYPTFLQKQHHFDTHTTGILDRDHERRRDRRRDLVRHLVGEDRAASARSSSPACSRLPVIPLWAFAQRRCCSALGGFPDAGRGAGRVGHHPGPPQRAVAAAGAQPVPRLRLPARQSRSRRKNAPIQAGIAESHGDNYALALALFAGSPRSIIAIWTALGPERKNADFVAEATASEPKPCGEQAFVRLRQRMSSYRGTADRPDQAKAIVAVVAVHAALAFVILSGLDVRIVRQCGRAADDDRHQRAAAAAAGPAAASPRPSRSDEEARRRGGEEGRADAGRRAPAEAAGPLAHSRGEDRRHRQSRRRRAPASPAMAPAPAGPATGLAAAAANPRFTPARQISRIPDRRISRASPRPGCDRGNVGVTDPGGPRRQRVELPGRPVERQSAPPTPYVPADRALRPLPPARDPNGRPIAQDITLFPTGGGPSGLATGVGACAVRGAGAASLAASRP